MASTPCLLRVDTQLTLTHSLTKSIRSGPHPRSIRKETRGSMNVNFWIREGSVNGWFLISKWHRRNCWRRIWIKCKPKNLLIPARLKKLNFHISPLKFSKRRQKKRQDKLSKNKWYKIFQTSTLTNQKSSLAKRHKRKMSLKVNFSHSFPAS